MADDTAHVSPTAGDIGHLFKERSYTYVNEDYISSSLKCCICL